MRYSQLFGKTLRQAPAEAESDNHRLLLRAGLVADYRGTFWRLAGPLLRQGRIEDVIRVGVVAHHLITFSRKAALGEQNASFYSTKLSRRAAAKAA